MESSAMGHHKKSERAAPGFRGSRQGRHQGLRHHCSMWMKMGIWQYLTGHVPSTNWRWWAYFKLYDIMYINISYINISLIYHIKMMVSIMAISTTWCTEDDGPGCGNDFRFHVDRPWNHGTSEKLKWDWGTQMHFLRFSSLLGRWFSSKNCPGVYMPLMYLPIYYASKARPSWWQIWLGIPMTFHWFHRNIPSTAPWNHGFYEGNHGKSSPNGRKIQVSEIWYFTQIDSIETFHMPDGW